VRAIGGNKTARYRATSFQQLARHCDIDVTDARRKGQNRALVTEIAGTHGQHFDIVGCGAGTLRDAGNGSALHWKSCPRRGSDNPFSQYTAAFASEGGD
jgi:hypothetical protein